MTGDTSSYGAGGTDAYLVKTDANGNMQWNKTYGGPASETACEIWKTSDGGYAVMATTSSYGAGGNDFWLLKIDAAGNLQWNTTYGGTGSDLGYSVCQTADGGYALLGYTGLFGAGAAGYDVWIVKTDGSGTMQWNKTYGGTGIDEGGNLILTADGGYALVSYSTSFGGYKGWLIKLDGFGNMVWNQTYSLGTASYATTGIQTADGGYAITGATRAISGAGTDAWLIKTDSSGNMLWNKTYGGAGTDYPSSIILTSDGGYAIAGTTDSFGAGGSDLWLIKTDASGVLPYKAPLAASAFTNVAVLPGWTWYFFVHSNGGVGAHTYQWYEGSTLLQGQTSMVLSVTKNTPGTYTFYCKVTDSEGTTVNSNNVTLTVMS